MSRLNAFIVKQFIKQENDEDVTLNASDQFQMSSIVVKEEIDESEEQLLTNERVTTQTLNVRDDEIVVKNELGEIANVIIPNESTPANLTESQTSNYKLFSNHIVKEEDCDCNEFDEDFCVKKEVFNDQQGVEKNVQLIVNRDESDNSSSRPTKLARSDHNDQDQDDDEDDSYDSDDSVQSSDDLDESNQSSQEPTKRILGQNNKVKTRPYKKNRQKQVITISLKCPQCSQVRSNRNALNAHLEAVHSTLKYRCLYKDCTRSFHKRNDLNGHYRTHPSQPKFRWPCGHCSWYSKSRTALYNHNLLQHETGLFQCAQPNCKFVAELKQTVHNHYGLNHKEFGCKHPGCKKMFRFACELEVHERTHLNVRPAGRIDANGHNANMPVVLRKVKLLLTFVHI